MIKPTNIHLAILVAFSASLTACGGGGSSSSEPVVEPPKTNPVVSKFGISGQVTGVTETGLKLVDGAGKTIDVAKDATSFTFGSEYLDSGSAYNVTVAQSPKYFECNVTNGKGTLSANVTNVNVACSPLPVKPVASVVGNKKFSWQLSQPLQVKLVDANRDNAPLTITGCADVDANKADVADDCSTVTAKRIGMQAITVKGENGLQANTEVQGVPIRKAFNITSGSSNLNRVVTPTGQVLIWGNPSSSETDIIGLNDFSNIDVIKTPTPILAEENGSPISDIYQVVSQDHRVLMLNEAGTVLGMGGYGEPYKGIQTENFPSPIQDITGQNDTKDFVAVTKVYSGYKESLALKDDGTVYQWGVTGYTYPDQVRLENNSPLKNIKAIAAGALEFYAITNEGKVYNWSINSSDDNFNKPQLVKKKDGTPLTGITKISAGFIHSLALDEEGKVWAWGANNYAQLGNSTVDENDEIEYAVQSALPAGKYKDVAVNFNNSYALLENGEVISWGQAKWSGQGANNKEVDDIAPANVVSETGTGKLTNVKSIVGFDTGAFALKADGSVVGWGDNYDYFNLTVPETSVKSQYFPLKLNGIDLKPMSAYPLLK